MDAGHRRANAPQASHVVPQLDELILDVFQALAQRGRRSFHGFYSVQERMKIVAARRNDCKRAASAWPPQAAYRRAWRSCPARARGSSALQIAWLTAMRRAPAARSCAPLSQSVAPRAEAARDVSARASLTTHQRAPAAQSFGCAAQCGPTPRSASFTVPTSEARHSASVTRT